MLLKHWWYITHITFYFSSRWDQLQYYCDSDHIVHSYSLSDPEAHKVSFQNFRMCIRFTNIKIRVNKYQWYSCSKIYGVILDKEGEHNISIWILTNIYHYQLFCELSGHKSCFYATTLINQTYLKVSIKWVNSKCT